MIVNRASDQLLTGTAFAENEHGTFRWRHSRHGFVNFQHGRTFTNDLTELGRVLIFAISVLRGMALQRPLRQRSGNGFLELR